MSDRETKPFRVAIIHPWLPDYRVPFFKTLVDMSAKHGILVDIFHGQTPPEWTARNDSSDSPVSTPLKTHFFQVFGRTLVWKKINFIKTGYDLVVLEQAVRNLESYPILLLGKANVAFWGHGKTYTKSTSRLQELLKTATTLRTKWFFVYTKSGNAALQASGYPPERITTVVNSIDTLSLRRDLESVTAESISKFKNKFGLTEMTGLFLGGLDGSKRIGFVIEAAQMAHRLNPDFRLLVAGEGDDRYIVEEAASRLTYVTYLGRVSGAEKAIAMRSAKVLVNPGRIGLVAVDSLIAGLPVVTVEWPFHAPEFDYLTPGVDCLIAENTPAEFGSALIELISDPIKLSAFREASLEASNSFSVEKMAENFISGFSGFKALAGKANSIKLSEDN